ncbi:glycosyltransferase [Marinoscillum sp.]|uniref:glycosyltransferase n=1 Tax=Marinoscillum sp. TaxID=2024838 RepID=UPI003BACA120
MQNCHPIALFTYNRLHHLKRTINSLLTNELANSSDLYVFSDGYQGLHDQQAVEEVRSFLNNIEGFQRVEICERPRNYGLSRNVISGVNTVLSKHQAVIVLEDDLYLSSSFLTVMNNLLDRYQSNTQIGSVSGYRYPFSVPDEWPDFFMLPRASSWGWGTWSDRWDEVDWDVKDYQEFIKNSDQKKKFNSGGNDLVPMLVKWKLGLNDSWAIRWAYYHYKMNKYCLFPKYNLVENIGNDGSGTHSPKSIKYSNVVYDSQSIEYPDRPEVHEELVRSLQRFFGLTVIRKLINLVILNLKSIGR